MVNMFIMYFYYNNSYAKMRNEKREEIGIRMQNKEDWPWE